MYDNDAKALSYLEKSSSAFCLLIPHNNSTTYVQVTKFLHGNRNLFHLHEKLCAIKEFRDNMRYDLSETAGNFQVSTGLLPVSF